jgi:primosomal protein N' (replication factor Y)
MFVNVALPLPIYQLFTYSVPDEFAELINIGARVTVPFKNVYYDGFIVDIFNEIPQTEFEIKPIYDILDFQPVLSEKLLQFYKFISNYYITPLGEVLNYATIPGTDLQIETYISLNNISSHINIIAEKKYTELFEALKSYQKIELKSLTKILKKNNLNAFLKKLEKDGILKIETKILPKKVKDKTVKFVRILKNYDEIKEILSKLSKKSVSQIELGIFIIENGIKEIELKTLIEISNCKTHTIKSLEQKGILEIYDEIVDRIFENKYKEEHKKIVLNKAQKSIFDTIFKSIEKNIFDTFLLHGVTASGKTQIYIELVKKVIEQNKNALILVPEISLTPQIVARFQNNFGDIVTFVHSKMSISYKHDVWKGIYSGKYKIVIGPRSAIFTPLENLGIVIVDEEHDSGYKQTDQMPTYNARDLAVYKAKLYNSVAILGSATPSIESLYNCKIGKYKYLSLTQRVNKINQPTIEIINLRKQNNDNKYFSFKLLKKIEEKLEKKEGIIILQNLKGFAPRVICKDCGNIHQCKYCSVPLVYHLNSNQLQCHYCGYSESFEHNCKKCGSPDYQMLGSGTEKIEDELQNIFPDAVIRRVDADSITNKDVLSKILNDFKQKKIDILVGTQILSKGLDFPHLSLVGVINADTLISIPNYKTEEKAMQILHQVSGRAGRSDIQGEVIIQTFNPENKFFEYLKQNKYLDFAEEHLMLRQKLKYPPFNKMIIVEIKSKEQKLALQIAKEFYNLLPKVKYFTATKPLEAPIFLLNKHYRYNIIIKNLANNDTEGRLMRKSITNFYINNFKNFNSQNYKILIDVDPI